MTDPMANPLHTCDIADRVEQLTPVDTDCDDAAPCPATASERPTKTTDRFAECPGHIEQEASPQTLLAYAVSHRDEPVNVTEIDDAFGITADHLFTTVLEHLNTHPVTALEHDTVVQVKNRAHHYLWVNRC